MGMNPPGELSPIQCLREMLSRSKITQEYGCTQYGREPAKGNCPHYHSGVDIVLPNISCINGAAPGRGKPPVLAPASGKIVKMVRCAPPCNTGYGNYAVIEAPNGFQYLLGHLNDFIMERTGQPLQQGQTVSLGEAIGHMGSTGNSSGPHLHLQICSPGNGMCGEGKPTVDPGGTFPALFGTLTHTLGGGAGFITGQLPGPPDPLEKDQAPPVPSPFPNWAWVVAHYRGADYFPNGDAVDPNATGQPGVVAGPGGVVPDQGSTTPPDYSQAYSSYGSQITPIFTAITNAFSTPGGLLAAAKGTKQTDASGVQLTSSTTGGIDLGQGIARTLLGFMVLLGGGFLILMGILALTREKPVQTVIQPVTSTAKTVGKVAAVAA